MKIGGYTRKVDELGRVVFPIEIRRKFKIEPGDQMRIYVEGGSIIIDFQKAEGIMPAKEKVHDEQYMPGDRINVLLQKVDDYLFCNI